MILRAPESESLNLGQFLPAKVSIHTEIPLFIPGGESVLCHVPEGNDLGTLCGNRQTLDHGCRPVQQPSRTTRAHPGRFSDFEWPEPARMNLPIPFLERGSSIC